MGATLGPLWLALSAGEAGSGAPVAPVLFSGNAGLVLACACVYYHAHRKLRACDPQQARLAS